MLAGRTRVWGSGGGIPEIGSGLVGIGFLRIDVQRIDAGWVARRRHCDVECKNQTRN